MVLSVYIWSLSENGSTGEASAVAVLMRVWWAVLTCLDRNSKPASQEQEPKLNSPTHRHGPGLVL